MSVTRCSHLVLLVLAAAVCGTLSAQTPMTSGERSGVGTVADSAPNAAPNFAHPKTTYPQIVRLSLVEGDVRVAVGRQKGLHGVAPWVQAAVNMLPGGRTSAGTPPVSMIAFDRKAQGFTITTRVNEGGRSQTFVDHFSGGVGGGREGGSGLRGVYGSAAAGGGGRGGYSGGGGRSYSGGGSSGGGSMSSGGASAAASGGGHSH